MSPSALNKTGFETKRICPVDSAPYFGVKSVRSDEVVYYQLASVFKAVTEDDQDMALKLMDGILSRNRSKFLLENRF